MSHLNEICQWNQIHWDTMLILSRGVTRGGVWGGGTPPQPKNLAGQKISILQGKKIKSEGQKISARLNIRRARLIKKYSPRFFNSEFILS